VAKQAPWAASQTPLQHWALLPQDAPAGSHACEHAPFTHVAPPGQRLPQAPQLLGSLVKSTHLPEHITVGAGQGGVQTSPLHTLGGGHVEGVQPAPPPPQT
jgi:hypothetical protein